MVRSPRLYVNNYVEFVFLLLRGSYVRLVYLLNMLSLLNKDIIIIIIHYHLTVQKKSGIQGGHSSP